jgi:hypothetical protein
MGVDAEFVVTATHVLGHTGPGSMTALMFHELPAPDQKLASAGGEAASPATIPESTVPHPRDGYWYEDKDGHKRTEGRAQWWKPGATTLRDIVRLDPSWPLFDEYDNQVDELPAKPFTESVPTYPPDAPPVLFGHYWFTPKDPMPSTDTTACIDFSAVKGGTLVAYRWDGEAKLRSENFVSV